MAGNASVTRGSEGPALNCETPRALGEVLSQQLFVPPLATARRFRIQRPSQMSDPSVLTFFLLLWSEVHVSAILVVGLGLGHANLANPKVNHQWRDVAGTLLVQEHT